MEVPVASYSFCIADGKSMNTVDDWGNHLHGSLLRRIHDFTSCLNWIQLVHGCT